MDILYWSSRRLPSEPLVPQRHRLVQCGGPRLAEAVRALFAGAIRVLSGGAPSVRPDPDPADFDVTLIDHDQRQLPLPGVRHTSETLAGYVRAFGGAPVVVSVDGPGSDFDLARLGGGGFPADLAVLRADLASGELWTGCPSGESRFLPWYWPALDGEPSRRRAQIRSVMEDPDARIPDVLGFGGADLDRELDRRAAGELSPHSVRLRPVTFRRFFAEACSSLPAPDRLRLARLSRGGSSAALTAMARVVAAELDLWVRRELLAPQNVLVDVPHLLDRLQPAGAEAYRVPPVALEGAEPYGLPPEFFDLLRPVLTPAGLWYPRPVFRWRALRSDSRLWQLGFAGRDARGPNRVFAEDLSVFTSGREFATELEGAWPRRFARELPGVRYAPCSRWVR